MLVLKMPLSHSSYLRLTYGFSLTLATIIPLFFLLLIILVLTCFYNAASLKKIFYHLCVCISWWTFMIRKYISVHSGFQATRRDSIDDVIKK